MSGDERAPARPERDLAATPAPDEDGIPVVAIRDPRDALAAVLREAQVATLKHPVAAQAAFAALVAEGRRHAATPEGARLRARLSRSTLLRRVREAWEVATFNLLEDAPAGPLPSAYVDTVLLAAQEGALEPVLARLAVGLEDPDAR